MKEERIWTVSEVNAAVKELIEGALVPVWIQGEVGNLTVHRSGHVYLTLKDEKTQMKGVFFSGAEQFRKAGIEQGTIIEAFGKLSVYEARGEYQFAIRSVRAAGMGDLQRRFEELKAKLAEEGLFDSARKKAIPMLPAKIGIVTSPEGAAIRDFLQIINRRFPKMNIKIYPAAVQGKGAEKELASGIRFFNRQEEVDVIVICRGGGSLEDLWPFNEEVLARAIAESSIPVISAVGHEVDFTICDFVADMRVPTPSAAAELVVGRQEEFTESIAEYRKKMKASIDLRLARLSGRLQTAKASYVFKEPSRTVSEKRQRIVYLTEKLASLPMSVIRELQQKTDMLGKDLENSSKRILERKKSLFASKNAQFKALNPLLVLQRGYSILTDSETGKTVTSPPPEGRLLNALLANGEISVRVEKNIQENDCK